MMFEKNYIKTYDLFCLSKMNKYDFLLFFLIVSLSFGGLGGAFTVPRILAIAFSPFFICLLPSSQVRKYFVVPCFFLIWFLYSFFSLFWTVNFSEGTKELVYYAIHFLYFLEIFFFAKYANFPLKIIPIAWLSSFLLTSTVGLWELFTDNHLAISKIQSGSMYRMNGTVFDHRFASVTFDNYNNYVTYICLCFPFLLSFFNETKMKRNVAIGAICLSFIFVSYNASRGGILALLGMFILFFIFHKKISLKLAGCILIISFVLYFLVLNTGMLDLLFARLMYTSTLENERIVIWKESIEMIKSTFFLGTGLGGLQNSLREFSSSGLLMPHNLFVEIFAQFGIFIFFLFLVAVVKIFINSFSIRDKGVKWTVVSAFIFLPVFSIINSGYLLFPQTYAFFSSITALVYYEYSRYYY